MCIAADDDFGLGEIPLAFPFSLDINENGNARFFFDLIIYSLVV